MLTEEQRDALKGQLEVYDNLAEKKKWLQSELKDINTQLKVLEKPLIEYLRTEEKSGFAVKPAADSESEEKAEIRLKKKPTKRITVNKKHAVTRLTDMYNGWVSDKVIASSKYSPEEMADQSATCIWSNLEKPDEEDSYTLQKHEPKYKKQKVVDTLE